jgi:hypothetical protein
VTPTRSPREGLSWLSQRLRLQDESQDWGLINADHARLEEFVTFLTTADLTRTEIFELVDLILASVNERLLIEPDASLEWVAEVVVSYPDALRFHSDYWRSLDDEEQFPVSTWLCRVGL